MKIKVHCFGKLPAYQDFVLYECTTPIAIEFRKWMESAFSGENDNGSKICKDLFAILVCSESQKEAIIGLIVDSNDQGGLRKFPVASFLTAPSKAIRKAAQWNSAVSLDPALREIENINGIIHSATNLSEVHECFKKWKPEPIKSNKKSDPLNSHFHMESDLKETVQKLGGADGNSTWNRLMWGMKQLSVVDLDWLTNGGIWWPLVEDMDTGFQVDFWSQLLNKQRDLAEKPQLPELYSMIYPRHIEEQHIGAVIFRPLIPEDSALLQMDGDVPPGIIDLAGKRPPLTLDGFYGFQGELRDLLDIDGLKMRDLFRLNLCSAEGISMAPLNT